MNAVPAAPRALLFAATLVIAGCATRDAAPYPSLARRPAESRGFDEPAAPVAAPVPRDGALDAKIAVAERNRAAASAAFEAGAARAERAARLARGAAAGSARWIEAQSALAELDSLRAAHLEVVNTLEDLVAARAQALAPAYPALDRAVESGRSAAAAQTARIDAIARTLAPA